MTGPYDPWEPGPVAPPIDLMTMILIYGLIALFLLACCVLALRGRRGPQTQVKTTEIHVRERVLVICPHCSTKVEQGVTFCPNCGGKM